MAQNIGKTPLFSSVAIRPCKQTGKDLYILSKISHTWHQTEQKEMQSEIIMTSTSCLRIHWLYM